MQRREQAEVRILAARTLARIDLVVEELESIREVLKAMAAVEVAETSEGEGAGDA